MHELAIADAVLSVARAHAGDRRLAGVEVEVGHLRQVVPSALAFAFELLAPGVELDLHEVPAEGRCRICQAVSVLPGFPLTCAACGSVDVEVVRGEELSVLSVDVETSPEANGGACGAGRLAGVTSPKANGGACGAGRLAGETLLTGGGAG